MKNLGSKVIEKEICKYSDFRVDIKIYGKIMNKDVQNSRGIHSKINEANSSSCLVLYEIEYLSWQQRLGST